ncbi:hypothetical protein [Gluconobacter kondonii]|uniref:hypothetical protein n=1 Tax=Gluconobacter kondonii TaxID=941463 RepID=UPI001980CA5F|nr:hypothetical protein [Gluconobacter kondonii]MBN3868647.1 hypothetical protein [Gluconobacter kondonii]
MNSITSKEAQALIRSIRMNRRTLLAGTAALGTVTLGLPERLLYWETYEPSFWQAARLGKWKIVRPGGIEKLFIDMPWRVISGFWRFD